MATGLHIHQAALYVKATKLELEGSFDKAFQLYIKCAEEQLRLSRLSSNANIRDRHKSEAAKALERAEKIRAKKRDLVTPVVKDHFSEGEQLRVLQQSSMVNGVSYAVWNDPSTSVQTIDLHNPRLSPGQLEYGATWQTPQQPGVVCDSEDPPHPEDIVQHVVSDCSLCASIAVCIDHDLRFESNLGKASLYPQLSEDLTTAANLSKAYSLRVLFNGAYRKANRYIDSQLPAYSDGKLMCMSAGSKRELWPSLVEKAYMKLMGGYDFPGSLSTTDLHALIGWIPETIQISSSRFEREKTWRLISEAYNSGTCVLTVGTGVKLPEEHLLPLPLLPAHCYAVIGVVDEEGERTMTILDNWVEGVETLHDQDLHFAIGEMTLQENEKEVDKKNRSQLCNVSWDAMCTVFDVLLISWDPGVFKNQLSFHGIWTKDMSLDESLPRNFHARLSVQSDKEADIWILLTRHVIDTTSRKDEYIALDAEVEDGGISYDMGLTGAYTNNTHVLIKTRSRTATLLIVASYDGASEEVGFTITVYSSASIQWAGSPSSLPYSEKITGALTSKNAGGNATLPTFMLNPQYFLRIHPDKSAKPNAKSRMTLSLAGDRRVPFNASVVWSQGQRVTDMSKSDIALSTGAYKFGYTSSAKAISPGEYTIVVSAFEPKQTGPFSLKIDCSTRIEVTTIPQEGSGMFSKVVRGTWTAETAAGGPSFNMYMSNPVYELKLLTQSQVKTRLQLITPDGSTAINVTLFRSTSRHTLGTHVATSGPYSDSVCGVVTPQITLQSGSYFIVPSTYNPGVQTAFKLLVYTSSNMSVERIQLP
ncbi:hypothetical protein BDY19DRAFT_992108 [Irpex rosettiformis]|uniref:Uncharacterized protein n=1 Tax=Irpex rosettiformis TaxID=378272 RepID=A0ACB8U8Z1_9APHY|nr:hypothetical protein BDY19DRAFT_992108 [Irpex rosettiformis]